MTPVLELLASFLGGALTASVAFMFAFVSRLTKVETRVADLCVKVDKLNIFPCPVHKDFKDRIDRIDSRVDALKK